MAHLLRFINMLERNALVRIVESFRWPKKFSFSSSSISYIGFFLASFVHTAERPTMNREKKKQLYEFSVHQCSGAKEANENSRAIMKKP